MGGFGNKNAQGNKGNTINHTGGRLKAGDVQKLLALWEGRIDINDIVIDEVVCQEKYIESVPVMKKVKVKEGKGKKAKMVEKEIVDHYDDVVKTRKVIRKNFKSGLDSMAYYVLTGDKQLLKNLLDKLYADQRNVTVDDITKPNRERLRNYTNEELHKLREQIKSEVAERD